MLHDVAGRYAERGNENNEKDEIAAFKKQTEVYKESVKSKDAK